MAKPSPMDTLRDLAKKAVDDATVQLGKTQQAYQQAVTQLDKLIGYEKEYREQLQQNMTGGGMEATNWLNYQQFINSLDKTVEHHRHRVAQCQQHVEQATQYWRQKKQRLNAFDALHERAETSRLLKENRLDQKLMDEYAQRATMKKERL